MTAFAARSGLPIRAAMANTRAAGELPQVLAICTRFGLDTVVGPSGWGRHTLVQVLQPGRVAQRAAFRYELHETSLARQRRTVDSLGRQGLEVVGITVDPPDNKVGTARERIVSLVARQNPAAAGPKDLAVHRTQLLGERLAALEAGGWQVTAYAQAQVDSAPTPEHILVVQHTERPMTHRVLVAAVGPGALSQQVVHNVLAAEAAAGWRIAGLCLRAETLTAVLRRPRELGEEVPPAADTGGPTRAASPLPPGARSDTTLLGEPLTAVPAALRFASDDGYVFDVDELVDLIEARGVATNPWTGQPFSEPSWDALLLHPSGAGGRLAAIGADNDARLGRLSAATGTQLLALAEVLAADATDGQLAESTAATARFRDYTATLAAGEQAALASARFTFTDTHGARFVTTIMGALSGLQNQQGCSRATARYLQEAARAVVARAVSRPRA